MTSIDWILAAVTLIAFVLFCIAMRGWDTALKGWTEAVDMVSDCLDVIQRMEDERHQ